MSASYYATASEIVARLQARGIVGWGAAEVREAIAKAIADERRAQQEAHEVSNAMGCWRIEEKYGGGSEVWRDVHAAFCQAVEGIKAGKHLEK